MDTTYTPIIILTLVGFFVVAGILLGPVWMFLKREEEASDRWTRELMEHEGGGDGTEPPEIHAN